MATDCFSPSPAPKACLKALWPQSLLGRELGYFSFKQKQCTQNNSSRLHFLSTTGLMEKRVSEAGHIFLVSLQTVSWSENWAGNQIQWQPASVLLLTYCITPFIICACFFCCFLKKIFLLSTAITRASSAQFCALNSSVLSVPLHPQCSVPAVEQYLQNAQHSWDTEELLWAQGKVRSFSQEC